MAKGQQRSTREKKKPKQDKAKPIAGTSRLAATSFAVGAPGGKKGSSA